MIRSYFIPLLAVALLGSQPSLAEDWVYLGGSPVAEMDMDSVYVENGLIYLEIRIIEDRLQSGILLKQVIEVDCPGSRIHISAESAITDPLSRLMQPPDAQRFVDEWARREGATLPADQAQAGKDAQPATTAPAAKPPVKPEPLRFPKGLTIQDMRDAGQREQSMTFSMGDGTSVRVGKAPPNAIEDDSRARLDFLISRSDQIITEMLKAGDIVGVKEFRNFVQAEEAAKLANETWQAMKREGSSSPRLDSLMERADDFILERVLAGDIEGAMVFRGYVQDRLAEHQRIILIPAKNDAYNTMFDYVCSNVRR